MRKSAGTIKGLTDLARNKINRVSGDNSSAMTRTRDIASNIQVKYEASGAKGKIDAVQRHVSGKLDEISGQAMYQLVEQRLAEQDRFNDLLATKLHDALERISQLEKKLAND